MGLSEIFNRDGLFGKFIHDAKQGLEQIVNDAAFALSAVEIPGVKALGGFSPNLRGMMAELSGEEPVPDRIKARGFDR